MPIALAAAGSSRSTISLLTRVPPPRQTSWIRAAWSDLVAERGDLEPPAGDDLADHEGRSPVDADVDPDIAALHAEAGHVFLDPSRRLDGAPCRPGLAAGLLGEEERRDAVPGVLADDPATVDDGSVDRRRQVADHREVGGRRELAAAHAGVLEVAEEDRRRPPRRLGQNRHPLEHPVVTAREHRLDAAPQTAADVEAEDPGEFAVEPNEPDHEPADGCRRGIREGRHEASRPGDRWPMRRELLEELLERTQLGRGGGVRPEVVAHERALALPPLQARVFIEAPDVRQLSRAGECRPAVAEVLVVVGADEVAGARTHVAEPPLGVDDLAGQAGVLECPRGFGERRIRRERVRVSLRFHSAPNLAADPLPCRTPDRVRADVDLPAPPRRLLDPRRPNHFLIPKVYAGSCPTTCPPIASW